jgi:acyl dehydratase
MALKLDVVGKKTAAVTHRYSWKDTVLYALGVGARADELDFLLEQRGPKVLPTFAVVPSFTAMVAVVAEVGANPVMVVHGEQKITLGRPIPPSGVFSTVAEVTGIYDKGKGAVIAVEAETSDEQGQPVFTNAFSIFVRGAGGFGGERGPEAQKAEPPEGVAPAFSVSERTAPEQALLYRLSGDLNPLHAAPEFAKMAGFDRPILHGLCTYGFAGRALLAHACGGDPRRLKTFAARFAGVVFPGDTLTTEGWEVAPGRWLVRTRTQDDRVVLANSVAETETAA